jgi:AcrR family transcriptional regulator
MEPSFRRGWDREKRMRALIDAALEVFAERGFDAATTREIASRAGCAEGLITRYFRNKQGLLEAAVQTGMQLRGEMMRVALPIEPDLLLDLRRVIRWAMRSLWEQRALIRVAVGRAMVEPGFGQTLFHLMSAKQHEIVERLRLHQAEGRIAATVDLEVAARSLMAVVFDLGFMKQVLAAVDGDALARMVDGAADLFARGVAASSPPRA